MSQISVWQFSKEYTYIEDIYFFGVNTKYISLSVVKKSVFFMSADIFTERDDIYLIFTKVNFLFILYSTENTESTT